MNIFWFELWNDSTKTITLLALNSHAVIVDSGFALIGLKIYFLAQFYLLSKTKKSCRVVKCVWAFRLPVLIAPPFPSPIFRRLSFSVLNPKEHRVSFVPP